MAPTIHRALRFAFSVIASSLVVVSVALAQARVTVEIRSPGGVIADGEITLTPSAGGTAITCRTVAGTCELADVPGGMYVATLQPTSGEPPPARTVVIPPSGRVTLRVSTH
jgi:hypothetical protein